MYDKGIFLSSQPSVFVWKSNTTAPEIYFSLQNLRVVVLSIFVNGNEIEENTKLEVSEENIIACCFAGY